ncbi:TetR family transcriptional regulator [Nocardia spumae]|uniref:TetR family transcriptional regulator n=1 Tax=Nocardia spumae TaxID=2887190 RepID=UPI001D14F0E0|nr:TetR family transcriptional regulator [Nocardia spumae]
MATAPNFQSEMRLLLRERVIDTARRLVCTEGWGAVNMSRVAKEVGVSRPVLYKEIGTKQDLADVVIANEVDVFLVGIAENLAAHPDDVISGVLAAIEFTLRTGADNMLLKAVLSGRSAPDTALLPALMTEPEPVLGRAIEAVTAAIRERYELAGVTDEELAPVAETVVRLALSHLFQPTGSVEAALGRIRVVAVGLFDPLLARD